MVGCPFIVKNASTSLLFSLNRPSGPIQSISRDVRLSVCMYVPSCEVPFKRLFAPIYEGHRLNFLDFLIP